MQLTRGLLLLAVGLAGCGDGCGALRPLPEGFPAIQRVVDTAQVQVTPEGIDALEAEPEAVIASALGSLELEIPPSCGGSPAICCTGGTPETPCGPMVLDVDLVDGDDARLVLTPQQGASRLDVTVRARVTASAFPVQISGTDCTMAIDTAPGASPDLEVFVPFTFAQDASAGTTRVVPGDAVINRLESEDISLTGTGAAAIVCAGFGGSLALAVDTLASAIAGGVQRSIAEQVCKACPAGEVAECGPFATGCVDQVCMTGDQCLQELGVTGRLTADALLGDEVRAPGAIDVYEIAGGTATTDTGGLQMWALGGLRPIGGAAGRCGPPAEAPAFPAAEKVLLDAGGSDVVIGVHADQLARLGYAAYQGGFLCQTFAGAELTSDMLLPALPSLAALLDETAPLEVGLRPQTPPVITLEDGAAIAAIFEDLEVDVFVEIERQPVRLFTAVVDATVPVALAVDADGAIATDVGAIELAGLSVLNVQGVTESPEAIAGMVDALVEGALEQLAGVGPIPLPSVAGVPVRATGIDTVDEGSHLSITADFAPAQQLGWFALLLLLLLAGAPACGGGGDDDGDEGPCGDAECEPGQVEHGPVGRWSSVATDGERTLVATYDQRLGDLVVVLVDGDERSYTAVDGVPDETPSHDGGYRGGVEGEGPDRGAWTSIALTGAVDGGRALVAYQDRDAAALRVAREATDGWTTDEVEDGGAQAALAVDGDGAAVIAHVVEGAADSELRLAREAGDGWDTRTLATVDVARGVDSPDVAVLGDGRVAVVYGDRARGAVVLRVEASPGGELDEVVLADRGRWPTVIADGDTLHVAYQDPVAEDLLYTTWDGAQGPVEPVDDGARADDRPHVVGAGAAIYLRSGGPRIAYQDGTTADVVVAEREDLSDSWSHDTLASGDPLDGFHLDAASPGVIVWDWLRADDADAPHNLEIRRP
ncbi:MAG TPA: hypothetical protein VMZ28_23690 [Kofleriaceae bacterium]|nr:hypothetical protein [Kofleriaceae bacterium]